jgi:hypothetical protein
MDIQYFAVEGFDGRFFKCDRYGTMLPGSCARNFREAPAAASKGRLGGCIGCAVGQFHCDPTAKPVPLAKPTSFAYREICVRCRRGGEGDNNRLIGQIRLVREHTTCVSCYNREREVRKGRNAKGAKPKKWRHLHWVQLASVAGGRLTIERFDHPVIDRLEAIYTLLRRKDGPRVMAWTASQPILIGAPA